VGRQPKSDDRPPVRIRRVDGQHVTLPSVGATLDPAGDVPAEVADELIASGVYEAVVTEETTS
jgi:hypothetical protein